MSARLSSPIPRLRARPEWRFFGELRRVSPGLATAWWILMALRALFPPLLAVSVGVLVRAVDRGASLGGPLTLLGAVFIVLQVLPPIHHAISANLGTRMSAALNERLMSICLGPAGIGHLERPDLTNDLTMARDFDLGIMGPPLSIGMDFIAGSLAEMLGGIASCLLLFAFAWWAPPVLLVAWGCTHWLLRESGVWKDRNTAEVQRAQRRTDYAFRLAVDPPAAKEIRLFGLAPWLIDRLTEARARLHELKWEATRLREKSVAGCLVIVLGANALVTIVLAARAVDGRIDLAQLVVFAQALFASSAIAFGGLNWALDGAAAPVAAIARLEAVVVEAGALREAADAKVAPSGARAGLLDVASMPAREIRFRDVTFGYPTADGTVLEHFDLTIPAGTSLAIVGQNGAGKTTIAKLLCRLYDPQSGAIEVDGVDLRSMPPEVWRQRLTAVFQDFVRYELPLRDNVAPLGASDADVHAALAAAGADGLAELGTTLARGYPGGTDLSGGQWQRIALARSLAAVRRGAGVVLLDEPTAMLDVRGESEIFERVLAATRRSTTILISHRFSTVRLADRICVVEHGRVIELGTHDELMALGGRYHTMYELQASRFVEVDDEGEELHLERL